MAELYVITNGAALPLGPLRGAAGGAQLSEADIAALPIERLDRAIDVPIYGGIDLIANPVPDAVKALVGQVAKFAIGWTDGTAAPTVTAGEFVFPATRSFIKVSGPVLDLAERFTESGKQTVIRLHHPNDQQDWIAGGASAPRLDITLSKKG